MHSHAFDNHTVQQSLRTLLHCTVWQPPPMQSGPVSRHDMNHHCLTYEQSTWHMQVMAVSRARSTTHRTSTRRATEPDMSLAFHTASTDSASASTPTQQPTAHALQAEAPPTPTEWTVAEHGTIAMAESTGTAVQIAVKVQRSLTWTEGGTADFSQSGTATHCNRCWKVPLFDKSEHNLES